MSFNPDWCIRPGVTLREWREENRLPLKAVARLCSMTPEQYEGIESGKRKITQVVACKLQQGTNIPARFWLNYESTYRAALAAGKEDVSDA